MNGTEDKNLEEEPRRPSAVAAVAAVPALATARAIGFPSLWAAAVALTAEQLSHPPAAVGKAISSSV